MLVIIAAIASLAQAREYLTEVASPVIETPGTASEIAGRGRQCIATTLGSGVAGGELILSDADNVIVARSSVEYSERFVPWKIRSRLAFEARDGRFRITQSSLERFNEYGGGWSPIGKWRGSGWQRAEQAFQETATALSACVTRQTTNDW